MVKCIYICLLIVDTFKATVLSCFFYTFPAHQTHDVGIASSILLHLSYQKTTFEI